MFTATGSSVNVDLLETVENWSPTEVATWLGGIDDNASVYKRHFIEKQIRGSDLLMMDADDFERFGIKDTAARLTILSALHLLQNLCYSVQTENLQMLAMQVGVKARNLYNELKRCSPWICFNRNAVFGWLPNEVLTHVSALAEETKTVVTWLDRRPFDSVQDYVIVRNSILRFATGIIQSSMRPSHDLAQTVKEIQISCTQLWSISDRIVQEFNDTLILQTAYLERITILRKNVTESFGFNVESTADGVHVVSEVKFQSPADLCGKVEAGDEIVQACGQTVVGWPLSKVALLLREARARESPFLLKKRPRAFFGHQNTPFKTVPGTPQFQKTRTPAPQSTTAPPPPKPPGKKRRRSSSFSAPRTPVEKIFPMDLKSSVPPSPISTVPLIVLPSSDIPSEKIEKRQPGTRQRRATVSGGSPTLKRLSLHLNRNSSISPRPPAQWFQGEQDGILEALQKIDRQGHVGDLDVVLTRSKLSRPAPNFRASYIEDKLYLPKLVVRKCSSSIGSSRSAPSDELRQSSEDDVFDEDPNGVAVQPKNYRGTAGNGRNNLSPASFESSPAVDSSSVESLLEEAEPHDVPVDATVDSTEWDVSKVSSDREETVYNDSDENRGIDGTQSSIHKTRSCPGRSENAVGPKLAKSAFATLPRSSQDKLAKFFGETPTGSTLWYDYNKEKIDESFVLSGSQASVTGGALSSIMSPRRSKLDLLDANVQQNQTKKNKDVSPRIEYGTPILMRMRRLTSGKVQIPPRSSLASESQSLEKSSPETSTAEFMRSNDSKKFQTPPKATFLSYLETGKFSHGQLDLPQRDRLKLSCLMPCKSLGNADLNGWVYRARYDYEQGGKKWYKRWLVLKKECLYIYHSVEDTMAEGVLWLPCFKVRPAGPDYKTSKKSVFKLESTRAIFYFYCCHRQDMLQWLEKLGLAAIGYDLLNEYESTHIGQVDAECYFVARDEFLTPKVPGEVGSLRRVKCQKQSPSNLSPVIRNRNAQQQNDLLTTIRQSWRRSALSREDSNSSSISCHSEGNATSAGDNKIIRDPLRVRGGEKRSKSAGGLVDSNTT